MKKQKYIVEIEMPDGDMISSGWLQDLIQADCDVEECGRQKVSVEEISKPELSSNLDKAAEELYPNPNVKRGSSVFANDLWTGVGQLREAFKAGAKWMAEQYELVYDENCAVPDERGGYWPTQIKLYRKKEE